MKGLNEKKIITKYRKSGLLYRLRNGDEVIGQEVDSDNRLVYIIKRDGVISLEHAENIDVIPTIHTGNDKTTIVIKKLN